MRQFTLAIYQENADPLAAPIYIQRWLRQAACAVCLTSIGDATVIDFLLGFECIFELLG